MQERELSISTGLVAYNLNGAAQVTFNPTDASFVERLFNTFDTLDKRQDAYKEEVEKASGSREIFDIAHKRDEEMRAMIDDALGQPVCDSIFGGMNVYAMADGFPVWCNLMLAIIDEIDTTFAQEQKATNPRLQKYLSKYHK